MREEKRKLLRREIDRDRFDILEQVRVGFDEAMRPLLGEIERQKAVRRISALNLQRAIGTVIFSKDQMAFFWELVEILNDLEGKRDGNQTRQISRPHQKDASSSEKE